MTLTKPRHPRTGPKAGTAAHLNRDYTTEDEVPAIIRQIVDRLHVSASGRDVIREVRSKLDQRFRRAGSHKRWRHNVYRMALRAHRENRSLYQQVMSGRVIDSMQCWPDLEAEAAEDLRRDRRPDA